ncbi:DUF6233 domain-containing protein [Streptomyces sp. NBC_00376]|uniref:DUF6233 domain-containing protein n=1 Tax=Streptomyces sp. NBC_00376 TaxID=2975730 RepID=UPI002E246B15
MSDQLSWSERLSPPPAAGTVGELPDHARETLRDVLDIAGRDLWSFPPFDLRTSVPLDADAATSCRSRWAEVGGSLIWVMPGRVRAALTKPGIEPCQICRPETRLDRYG